MSGRDRLFSQPQEDELVRGVVEEYLRETDPDQLEELDDVFDLIHSMVDDRIGRGKSPGQRSIEGLAADASFFTGALVTSAIWAATVLYRHLAESSASPEQRLEGMLAELTGNPRMVARLREKIAMLSGFERLTAETVAPPAPAAELRNVQRRLAEAPDSTGAALAPPPVRLPLPPAPSAAVPLARMAGAEPDLRLFVNGRADLEGPLSFRLKAKDPSLGLVYSNLGEVQAGAHLRSYVAELTSEIARLHQLGPAGHDEAGRRMERLGERLADQLVPEKLRTVLDSLRGRALSLIVYADAFVPWELLRFPDRPGRPGAFWATEFALTRWFTGAPEVFELPLRRIALVAPRSDLAATTVEARTVRALAGADRQVVPLAPRRGRLFADLFHADFDGIHFAGHGMSPSRGNPDFGQLLLEGDEFLDAIDVPRESLPAHPLVFLNACHSGEGGALPIGIGGLAKAFIDAGAAAVVGSHWAIADGPAETFAAELYRGLLAGVPLAEAVRQARLTLRDARLNDPTWIAYTVFGQPGAACPLTSSDP